MNGFSSNQQSQYFGESKAELIARRKEKEKRRDDLKWAKLPLTTKLGGLLKDKEAAHNSGDIAERDRLDGEINALEIEIKPYTDAIKILNQEIKDINMILRNPEQISTDRLTRTKYVSRGFFCSLKENRGKPGWFGVKGF